MRPREENEAGVFANTVCTCIDCRAHRVNLLSRLKEQITLDDAAAKADPVDPQFTDTVGGRIE